MGDDPVSGKNFDHRKQWIENEVKKLSAAMGIDLLGLAILSNHFHLILRSRPDVVATWDDTEIARRWLLLCPRRKNEDGSAAEPAECELNSIRHDPDRLAEIRLRLSDISWWKRLLCQTIAIRANREDGDVGKFCIRGSLTVREAVAVVAASTTPRACAFYLMRTGVRSSSGDGRTSPVCPSSQRTRLRLTTKSSQHPDARRTNALVPRTSISA